MKKHYALVVIAFLWCGAHANFVRYPKYECEKYVKSIKDHLKLTAGLLGFRNVPHEPVDRVIWDFGSTQLGGALYPIVPLAKTGSLAIRSSTTCGIIQNSTAGEILAISSPRCDTGYTSVYCDCHSPVGVFPFLSFHSYNLNEAKECICKYTSVLDTSEEDDAFNVVLNVANLCFYNQ